MRNAKLEGYVQASQLFLSGEVCNIHTVFINTKIHHSQSVNGHKLGRFITQDAHMPNWRKPFPSGSLSNSLRYLRSFSVFFKFPEFSLTGKMETRFPGFP